MILEAFSQTLRREWEQDENPATEILHGWLFNILTEASPIDNVSKVIHAEVALIDVSGNPSFIGRSKTGETLLKSLYLYCESFERWQFSRWLHHLKPHHFDQIST